MRPLAGSARCGLAALSPMCAVAQAGATLPLPCDAEVRALLAQRIDVAPARASGSLSAFVERERDVASLPTAAAGKGSDVPSTTWTDALRDRLDHEGLHRDPAGRDGSSAVTCVSSSRSPSLCCPAMSWCRPAMAWQIPARGSVHAFIRTAAHAGQLHSVAWTPGIPTPTTRSFKALRLSTPWHELSGVTLGVEADTATSASGCSATRWRGVPGTSYEALVETRICRPLGHDEHAHRAVAGAARAARGRAMTPISSPVANWDFAVLAGTGALRSSANDLLTFLAANLGFTTSPLAEADGGRC